QVPPPVEAPPAPPRTAAAAKEGAEVYKATGCAFCHGEKGLADGPSAPALTYDSGKPVVPANFTKLQDFKCGNRPEDIFRTISTTGRNCSASSTSSAVSRMTATTGRSRRSSSRP